MKLNLIRLVGFLFVILNSSSLQAAFLAEIDFSIAKGYINIEPTVANLQGARVFTGRKSGCCNLLSLFQREKEILPEDHYFFLNGDPDDLSLSYIQLVCLNGILQNTTSSSVDLDVMQGKASLAGIFFSGEQLSYNVIKRAFPLMFDVLRVIYFDKFGLDFVGQINLNEVSELLNGPMQRQDLDYSKFMNLACSSEFRKVFDQNRVVSGNYKDKIFNAKFNGKTLRITWDTDGWRDETQRTYDALMERYRALYEESKMN